jgi:histidine triad (HIT) family protein
VGQRLAAALYASDIRCEGVNFFLADGEAAGQEVFHVHLHVLPRFAGDGFGLRFPPDYRVRDRSELDAVARALR